jgi:hypothetical protein
MLLYLSYYQKYPFLEERRKHSPTGEGKIFAPRNPDHPENFCHMDRLVG